MWRRQAQKKLFAVPKNKKVWSYSNFLHLWQQNHEDRFPFLASLVCAQSKHTTWKLWRVHTTIKISPTPILQNFSVFCNKMDIKVFQRLKKKWKIASACVFLIVGADPMPFSSSHCTKSIFVKNWMIWDLLLSFLYWHSRTCEYMIKLYLPATLSFLFLTLVCALVTFWSTIWLKIEENKIYGLHITLTKPKKFDSRMQSKDCNRTDPQNWAWSYTLYFLYLFIFFCIKNNINNNKT